MLPWLQKVLLEPSNVFSKRGFEVKSGSSFKDILN